MTCRTDSSTVLDTAAYTYKLYTVDGGVKVLKRKSGQIEKQYRQNAGKLPIAYRLARWSDADSPPP
jgi:hypothetical protein